MFGYRVYDKFDKMSYLITRSCFHHEVNDDSSDEESKETYHEIQKYIEENSEDVNAKENMLNN